MRTPTTRSVSFSTSGTTTDRVDAHFTEMQNSQAVLVDIRGYFLPEDHCTIGPDIHNWIMHGIKPDHSAPIPTQPCTIVHAHIGTVGNGT